MPRFDSLSCELTEKIKDARERAMSSEYACRDDSAVRRMSEPPTPYSPYSADADRIIDCPYYNRYTDKTQVFSLLRNDDITRRSLHVQLVSRVARRIGQALGLNTELIEAIALGHDIGHPPFAHAGEKFLDGIVYSRTGRHFSHAVHSVRVLDRVFELNLSLPVLTGIISHNVKLDDGELRPEPIKDFCELDGLIEACGNDRSRVSRIVPSTMEAYVVRLADIIAYVGRDRHDTRATGFADCDVFADAVIGTTEAEIVNNLTVNIIENSYGKPYIALSPEHLSALKRARSDNYAVIYDKVTESAGFGSSVKPMMEDLYEKLLDDLRRGDRSSPVFTHHIDYINSVCSGRSVPYGREAADLIVTDYIASMTDDYFVDIYERLFPGGKYSVVYKGYFD